MNVIDALNSRFTVRAFEPDPVHKGTILKILDAATRAPSSGNTQPWELFVAGGDALDRLRRAFEERFRKGVPGSPDLPAPQQWPPALQKRIDELKAARFASLGIEPEDAAARQAMSERIYQLFGAPTVVYLCMDRTLTAWSIFDMGLLAQSIMLAAELIDEDTICVGVVLGTTFTGEIDPIEDINDLLVDVKRSRGWDTPIHVDAAIGGFILPFSKPQFKWDFRLEQVKSINVSAHKYGLVYPGLGWLIFRDTSDLPEELMFYVNYLGDEMASYTLNFSRGSGMLLAQYYNLLRLGWQGYERAAHAVLETAQYLTQRLLDLGHFDILNAAEALPVITLQLKEPVDFSVHDLSAKLRERGWIVPAYTLPPNADHITIMRVVVRQNFSRDMADLFVEDVKKAYETLLAPKIKTIVKQRSPRESHPVS